MPDQFLVLTASEGVSDAVVHQACEALAGSHSKAALRRLSPDAVEVGISGPIPSPDELSRFSQSFRVDANIVAGAGREKKLLIADMDSTIIDVECIDELADYAGVKAQVSEITERAMRGELDFEAALIARVSLMRGLTTDALAACYNERVKLNPGARTLVQTMASRGADTALVSGGFTFFSARVAAAAGFASSQANVLLSDGGVLTGEVGRPIVGQGAKLAALNALTKGAGITPADAIAVGDGANDLSMVEAAGIGVAFHAKPALSEAADVRLNYSGLTALLALQGIPEDEWMF